MPFFCWHTQELSGAAVVTPAGEEGLSVQARGLFVPAERGDTKALACVRTIVFYTQVASLSVKMGCPRLSHRCSLNGGNRKNGFIQGTKGSKYLDQGKAHAVARVHLYVFITVVCLGCTLQSPGSPPDQLQESLWDRF